MPTHLANKNKFSKKRVIKLVIVFMCLLASLKTTFKIRADGDNMAIINLQPFSLPANYDLQESKTLFIRNEN